jgi:hypothetical protein
MLVRGNAYMRLPAVELGQSTFAALGTNQPVKVKATTNEFAQIFSAEYLLTPAAALFRGNVRIVHPQIKETCEELTMLSPPELGKTGHMVIAEPAVVFDVVDDEGRNFHADQRYDGTDRPPGSPRIDQYHRPQQPHHARLDEPQVDGAGKV